MWEKVYSLKSDLGWQMKCLVDLVSIIVLQEPLCTCCLKSERFAILEWTLLALAVFVWGIIEIGFCYLYEHAL